MLISLFMSLTASAMGCVIPLILDLLGPLRFCVYLMTFRSISVKNAMLMNTIKMIEIMLMEMSMVYIICCMSVNIIAVLTMSWSSNSNYSLLGMMRTVSQLVSYEINMMMIILLSINMSEQMNLEHMTALTKSSPISLMMSITLMMWMITSLAETNRTPFDFSEGESELISGFNVEFSGKSFMFLFLAEYSSILIMAMMTTTLFFSAALPSPEFVLVYLALCFTFVWTRTSLPRFRYDKLMKINWQQILPTTMTALMLSFSLKLYYTKKYK